MAKTKPRGKAPGKAKVAKQRVAKAKAAKPKPKAKPVKAKKAAKAKPAKPKAKAAKAKPKAKAARTQPKAKAAKTQPKAKVAKTKPKAKVAKTKASRARRADVSIGDNATLRADGTLELRVDLTPGMMEALEADQALEAGDFQSAVRHLDAAIAADGPNVHYLVSRGQARYQLGQHDDAITDFERALQLRPDFPDLHFEKGKAELRARRYAEAEASFTRDLGAGEPSPITYFNRHSARKGLGNIGGALADLDIALELLPDSVPLRLARVDLRTQDGDAEGAIADLKLAIAAQPDDAQLYDKRARLAFSLGRYKLAADDFQSAAAIHERQGLPAPAEWYGGIGLALGELGALTDAVAALDRAIEIDPDSPRHVSNRGWILHLAGRHHDAIRDFDQAIELDAGYAKAYHNRSVARAAMGDHTGASLDRETLRAMGHAVDG